MTTITSRAFGDTKKSRGGLAKEICEELNILDCNTIHLSKIEYKDLVNARKMEEKSGNVQK